MNEKACRMVETQTLSGSLLRNKSAFYNDAYIAFCRIDDEPAKEFIFDSPPIRSNSPFFKI